MNDEDAQETPATPGAGTPEPLPPAKRPAKAKSPRGPGRPRKATEELVDLAAMLLPKAVKAAVKAAVMKQSGCSWRTAEDVIRRARERFREDVNEPADLQRSKYLAMYDSIAFDTTRDENGRRRVSDRDRIMAASSAQKLLGLEIHTHAPAASKEDLFKQFLADPAARSATLPPGVFPSAPPAATPDAADAPVAPAVDGAQAPRRAGPALESPGPVQDGGGGPPER